MIRVLAWPSLLLLLSACAAPAAPAVCDPRPIAVLPATLQHNAVLVPVEINGTTVRMEIDTGSTSTMLTDAAVQLLGLPPDPFRTTRAQGTGGIIATRNALVSDFEIGGIHSVLRSVPTGRLDLTFHGDTFVAGLLGLPDLVAYDIELDLPDHRMTLWSARGCSESFVKFNQPQYVVPLVRNESGLLYMTVYIDGHPLRAIIDWGAQHTVMTLAAARRIGLTDAMLESDFAGTGHGVDQVRMVRREHRFDELRIGEEVLHGIRIGVAPLTILDGDMLLGMDFAQSRRIWLSWRSRQMVVAPEKRNH